MSDADIERKFIGLAEPQLPNDRISSIISACWSLESVTDAATPIRLCTPS